MKTLFALAFAMAGITSSALAQQPDLKLWRLDCGEIVVKDLNAFSDDFAYTGQSKTLTNSCYLIKHGDAYMMWDTGFSMSLHNAPLGDAAMAPTFKTTIAKQLKALDVAPEQISLVGISHNHFDHLGQASEFPKATLLIGKADFEGLKQTPPPFGADPKLAMPWLSGGSKVEALEGDKDVFGDGSVTILTTPGHTAGSQSLLVRLNKAGPVILSGDTVHFEEQIANDGVPPFNVNRANSLASMERLETLAKNLKATFVVQHDAADIAKLPAFPQAAE